MLEFLGFGSKTIYRDANLVSYRFDKCNDKFSIQRASAEKPEPGSRLLFISHSMQFQQCRQLNFTAFETHVIQTIETISEFQNFLNFPNFNFYLFFFSGSFGLQNQLFIRMSRFNWFCARKMKFGWESEHADNWILCLSLRSASASMIVDN